MGSDSFVVDLEDLAGMEKGQYIIIIFIIIIIIIVYQIQSHLNIHPN